MGNDSSGRPTSRTGGESLVEVEYIDPDGLKWRVLVPQFDRVHPERGIVVGPPSLEFLDLPVAVHDRLHNALYDRGLIRARDLKGKSNQLFAAIQFAYRVDLARVSEAFLNG